MQNISKLLMVGVGMLAFAGSAVAAEARVMNVALPDGSVARIRYSGDVAPRVVVVPVRTAPIAADVFAPFAMLDRWAAEMDRRMQVMLRQAEGLAQQASAADGQVSQVAAGSLSPGTVSYSFVSTSTGSGVCGRSVQVTSTGPDQPAKVVSKTFGECADAKARPQTSSPQKVQTPRDYRKTI